LIRSIGPSSSWNGWQSRPVPPRIPRKVELRQARAAAQVGYSLACPFDLHALLPVLKVILLLEPTHPEALAWLTAQRGGTDRPRQVVVRARP
jgi:hypothetical protein